MTRHRINLITLAVMASQTFIGRLIDSIFHRGNTRHDNGNAVPPRDDAPVADFLLTPDTLARLRETLQYDIKNVGYFELALLHRSYLQVLDDKTYISNERMEFLGDAVVNLVIAHYLYDRFTELQEGALTKYRSRLVNRRALALCAWKLQLNTFIMLNSSAEQSLVQGNDSLLADCFEAILAAIYLDSGGVLDHVRTLVHRVLLTQDMFESFLMIDENYKSTLLEYAQAHHLAAPRYFVVKEDGPDHDKIFTIEVFLGQDCKGRGQGRSKKDAEQQAAMQAVDNLSLE